VTPKPRPESSPARRPSPAARTEPARLWIRADKREVPFDDLPCSNWLANTLRVHGLRRLGDLDGRTISELASLKRVGRVQLRELRRLLRVAGALDIATLDDREPRRRLGALLEPGTMTSVARRIPPYEELRHERIAIRPEARDKAFADVPLPWTLHRALGQAGRRRFGDLHGLSFNEALLADPGAQPRRGVMRLLFAVLRFAGIRQPPAPLFVIPPRVRHVPLEDVPMPRPLRNALRARALKTLGDVGTLTPARLGAKFGRVRRAALEELVRRAPSLPLAAVPFARAIDDALASLPAPERRALLLRCGARARPLTIRDVGARLRWKAKYPEAVLAAQLEHLRDAGGVPLARSLRALRDLARRRRARIDVHEATRVLRIESSRARYSLDFYLRLLNMLERGLLAGVP
jgi:hypothetical protein